MWKEIVSAYGCFVVMLGILLLYLWATNVTKEPVTRPPETVELIQHASLTMPEDQTVDHAANIEHVLEFVRKLQTKPETQRVREKWETCQLTMLRNAGQTSFSHFGTLDESQVTCGSSADMIDFAMLGHESKKPYLSGNRFIGTSRQEMLDLASIRLPKSGAVLIGVEMLFDWVVNGAPQPNKEGFRHESHFFQFILTNTDCYMMQSCEKNSRREVELKGFNLNRFRATEIFQDGDCLKAKNTFRVGKSLVDQVMTAVIAIDIPETISEVLVGVPNPAKVVEYQITRKEINFTHKFLKLMEIPDGLGNTPQSLATDESLWGETPTTINIRVTPVGRVNRFNWVLWVVLPVLLVGALVTTALVTRKVMS